MKKFSFLFLMALSVATVFTSCGEDEAVTPPVVAPVLVKEYTAVLLTAPQSTNESLTFGSLSNGKTYSYTSGAAGTNFDSVDIAYWYSSTHGAVLVSPDNYDAIVPLTNWARKNTTSFQNVVGGNRATYDAVSRNTQLDTVYTNGTDIAAGTFGQSQTLNGRVGQLVAGSVTTCQAKSGKKAIIYVESVVPISGPSGIITLRIKVQR